MSQLQALTQTKCALFASFLSRIFEDTAVDFYSLKYTF